MKKRETTKRSLVFKRRSCQPNFLVHCKHMQVITKKERRSRAMSERNVTVEREAMFILTCKILI